MDPTPKKWWSGWPEWLAGAIGRWCNRYRATAAERRLTGEIETLRGQIKTLDVELEQAVLDLASSRAEAKAEKDQSAFLETIVERHRQQVQAEIAVTARQIVEGRIHGDVRRSK